MKPIERLTAYAQGKAIDRLPCVPIVGNGAARVTGDKVSDLRGNARLLANAQIAAYRRFGYDVIRVFTDLYVMAEAMGAHVHCPTDETAYLVAPAITDGSRIEDLSVPDPWKSGNLPHHLEAMDLVAREVGDEAPVTGALTGPFTNASFLIGTEDLLRLAFKKPAVAHKLCEISLHAGLVYAEAILSTGCVPSLTDPMSSCSVIGPKIFKEFSFPYLKRLIDFIHAKGSKVTLHICGQTSRIWKLMAEAGADCLSIDDEASLTGAREMVGSQVRLMGNVPPATVTFMGSPADVRKAVHRCVAKAWDNPKGYIVASGCSLPTDTPLANIDAMMDAVREVGFPVNVSTLEVN
jgi:uroporphyrinogen decarboxylase